MSKTWTETSDIVPGRSLIKLQDDLSEMKMRLRKDEKHHPQAALLAESYIKQYESLYAIWSANVLAGTEGFGPQQETFNKVERCLRWAYHFAEVSVAGDNPYTTLRCPIESNCGKGSSVEERTGSGRNIWDAAKCALL